jgi:cysteine synthase B
VQPEDGAKIAGIRRWPKAYLPKIFDAAKVDAIMVILPYFFS